MGTQPYRTLPLVLLSATLGFTTGMLVIAGLGVLLVGYDAAGLSPWLDPRALSNWLVLCCLAVLGAGLAVLAEHAERRATAKVPIEASTGPSGVSGSLEGSRREVRDLARVA